MICFLVFIVHDRVGILHVDGFPSVCYTREFDDAVTAFALSLDFPECIYVLLSPWVLVRGTLLNCGLNKACVQVNNNIMEWVRKRNFYNSQTMICRFHN